MCLLLATRDLKCTFSHHCNSFELCGSYPLFLIDLKDGVWSKYLSTLFSFNFLISASYTVASYSTLVLFSLANKLKLWEFQPPLRIKYWPNLIFPICIKLLEPHCKIIIRTCHEETDILNNIYQTCKPDALIVK